MKTNEHFQPSQDFVTKTMQRIHDDARASRKNKLNNLLHRVHRTAFALGGAFLGILNVASYAY